MKNVFKAKRLVALMLVFVFTLTTVFTNGITSQAASSKAVKSVSVKIDGKKVTKKTYYVLKGAKKTLKVSVNPTKAKKSVSFKTSNKKVATVSKSGKVSAKKKLGTAKITIKVKGKNNKTKSTWVKIKVVNTIPTTQATATTAAKATTQATATTAANATTQAPVNNDKITAVVIEGAEAGKTVQVNKTIQLKATVFAEGNVDKSITWSSDDVNVATVKDGIVTGIKPGKTTITATTKNGFQSKIVITVIEGEKTTVIESDDKRISLDVKNAVGEFSGQGDYMLFTGSRAEVKVQVKNADGTPVGKQGVELNMEAKAGNNANLYELSGEPVKETDENGYVTFYVVPSDNSVTPTTHEYESYWVEAVSTSDRNIKVGGSLSFGYVYLDDKNGSSVYVANQTDDKINDIEPGQNAQDAGDETGVKRTESKNGSYNVQYVSSQQVTNKEEKVDHAVYFGMTPVVNLPAKALKDSEGDYIQEIGYQSGVYSVYNDEKNEQTTYTVKEIPAGLEWANIVFNGVTLSKYTTMSVKFYNKDTDALVKEYTRDETSFDEDHLYVQIPVQDDTEIYAVISLISEGQIDNNNNKGYDLARIQGEWKSEAIKKATKKNISAAVEWKEDKGFALSDKVNLSTEQAVAYLGADVVKAKEGYTYQYSVPAFPRVGNAIIYGYDKNGEVQDYYTYPSENVYADGKYQNKNDICAPSAELKATLISKDEAKNIVGSVETVSSEDKKDMVKVDSVKTGYTPLKATVDIKGAYGIEITNPDAYTSVAWAPYYNRELEEVQDFYALHGQNVVVTAQLYDKAYGNKVTQEGKEITFETTKGYELKDYIRDHEDEKFITDKEGVCTLTLSSSVAADKRYLDGLTAKTEGYEVRLSIKGNVFKKANIHWIDAGLYFKDKADTETTTGNAYEQFSGVHSKVNVDKRETLSSWTFGMKVVGQLPGIDTKDGLKVSEISGITIGYDKADSVEGTTDGKAGAKNGEYILDAKGIGTTTLTGSIDKNSVTNNVNFTITEPVEVTDPEDATKKEIVDVVKGIYPNVGEGQSLINATLPISVEWTRAGLVTGVQSPLGDTLDVTTTTTVYIKAVDKGGNPVANDDVEYTIKSTDIPTLATEKITAKTDENGLVAINLKAPAKEGAITINGKVAGTEFDPYTISYTNSNQQEAFKVVSAKLSNESGKYVVAVKFNTTINKDTFGKVFASDMLTKDAFKKAIKFTNVADTNAVYEIESASIASDADTIKFVLKNNKIADTDVSNVKFSIAPFVVKGMTYQISDKYNRILVDNPATVDVTNVE